MIITPQEQQQLYKDTATFNLPDQPKTDIGSKREVTPLESFKEEANRSKDTFLDEYVANSTEDLQPVLSNKRTSQPTPSNAVRDMLAYNRENQRKEEEQIKRLNDLERENRILNRAKDSQIRKNSIQKNKLEKKVKKIGKEKDK